MKEWNHLVNIIESFIYDKEVEELIFDESPKALEAKQIYENIIEEYSLNDESERWAFDIALDCVRNMRDEDRAYLTESYDVDFFGYGLYIRNEYIHCSRKHHAHFSADSQCSVVLEFIYTILHRYYNRFNSELCDLLRDYDYESINRLYKTKFPFIEEETLRLTEQNNKLKAKEVLNTIKQRIRRELGRNGFKDIFLSVVNECGKDCLAPQPWLNFVNKLYSLSPVYIKEYNQVKALKEAGLISELLSTFDFNKISNVNECRAYIDEKLGLNEEDAQLLAETMWEAFKN